METPPPAPEPQPQPQPTAAPHQTGFYAGVRRIGLWRSDDHWIGGVAGGLAERLGVDALVVRGIFVVTVLLGGVGLLAYGVGWLLLPHRRDGRILVEEVFAGRFDIAFVGATAFTIVGLSRGGGWLVGWPGMPHGLRAVGGLLWLGLLAVVVAVVVSAITTNRTGRATAPTPARPAGAAPAGTAWAVPQPGDAPTSGPGADPAGTATTGAYPTAPYPTYPAYPTATTPYAAGPPTATYPTTYPTAYPATQQPAQPYAATATVPPAGGSPTVPYKPRQRPSGPGAAVVGTVVALSLLTLAGLLVADRNGDFDGPIALTALGVAIVLAGLGIVVSGLRGRTSGVLGFLAIVGLLVAMPLGLFAHSDWAPGGDRRGIAQDVTPVTRADAERGWSFGLGDSTVRLTDVPLTGETLDVPVSLGAGDLTVVLPAGATVVADVRIGAGTFTWQVDGRDAVVVSGSHLRRTEASPDDGTTHQVHLNVSVGAGNVTITQEQP